MLKKIASEDPRFLRWNGVKPSDPLNLQMSCYGYAVGNEATLEAAMARGDKVPRAPEVGNASGMPMQIYVMGHRPGPEAICLLAERDGLTPVKVGMYDALPEPPQGMRLVAVVCGSNNGVFEDHWLREHNGLWTSKFGHLKKPKETDMDGKIITDPRNAKFYGMQKGPFFFFVPQDGIDLRLNPAVEHMLDQAYIEQERLRLSRQKTSPVLAESFSRLADLYKKKDSAVSAGLQVNAAYYRTGKKPDIGTFHSFM